jgi:hypothetical protein
MKIPVHMIQRRTCTPEDTFGAANNKVVSANCGVEHCQIKAGAPTCRCGDLNRVYGGTFLVDPKGNKKETLRIIGSFGRAGQGSWNAPRNGDSREPGES